MKKRPIQLADGTTMVINDNEWVAVVNRKEFDANETEILRITRHQSKLMSRIYAMRSTKGADGKMTVVSERNEITFSDDVKPAAAKAIAETGLTKITADSI